MSFPKAAWRDDEATFTTHLADPVRSFAALVFAFYGDKLVLAELPGRGWCIPSGRIESGESAEEAARRETFEEAGVTLGRVACLGHFVLKDRTTGAVRHAPTFIADVQGLEEVPPESESTGRLLVHLEDIAGLYYSWDDLLAAVFEEAAAARERLLPSGLAISELIAQPD